MAEYIPLDLSRWATPHADIPPVVQAGAPGLQTLRGLPFDIRPIHFTAQTPPAAIPLSGTARWLLFAHCLLESHMVDGGPLGLLAAHYVVHFRDGEPVALPIRGRFEINVVPAVWDIRYYGQMPFVAVPDRADMLLPRDAGPWQRVGWRQCEVSQPEPSRFWLWAWRNPYPDRPLDCLSIEPRVPDLVLGGVTLSELDEDPLGNGPRLPLCITLADPQQADQPFNLSVDVDRGVATYPYPLPRGGAEAFLGDAAYRGWGQDYSHAASPAYAEIAALPSATLSIKAGEEELARARWGDVLELGALDTPSARIEVLNRGKNWVHVTVVDDTTGAPLPCRVHFRSPDGVPFQPHGHHDHLMSDGDTWHLDVGGDLRLGHVTYAYIDGKCQGWLPRGEVLVDAACGFEYEPLRSLVEILPGQRELTLRLKRWTDQNAEGWFSGDTHVHFLSTVGAQLEAQGEGLNVVNLLASQWGHLFTSAEEILGRPLITPDGRTIVYANQENRQHMLGHLTLLGLKQPVMPWCSGGPDEAELAGTLETTLSHWADACHAQGGTVIIPHLPVPNGEPAALIATGRADAVEMLMHVPYMHNEYYRYLNNGYRLPLVGGTDKMTADVPVGLFRTYVAIPPNEPFDYDAWLRNMRQGRTFISSGPMLRFTVNGAQVGDTLNLPGNGGTVEVQAEARSIFPIHTLQIVQEGRVVAETVESAGARTLTLRASLRLDHHTWLAARVSGPGYFGALPHYDCWRRGIMAHTSPVYVAVGGAWWMHSHETAEYMLTLLHGSLEYIRQRGAYPDHGHITHHHGESDHQAFLERPFHEAIAAVEGRIARK